MDELNAVWEAYPINEMPDMPDFEDFIECYEDIDIGYDVFLGKGYVYGPYALIYDEERFRRDLWGWSVQVAYIDEDNRYCYDMISHKLSSAEEAYEELRRWSDEGGFFRAD